jgi:hypothetical protein
MNLNYFLITHKKINGLNRQKVIALTLTVPVKSNVNLTSITLV